MGTLQGARPRTQFNTPTKWACARTPTPRCDATSKDFNEIEKQKGKNVKGQVGPLPQGKEEGRKKQEKCHGQKTNGRVVWNLFQLLALSLVTAVSTFSGREAQARKERLQQQVGEAPAIVH